MKSTLYLNANIIYSDIINKLKGKKKSVIDKLREYYILTTSILTRFEVMKNLNDLKGIPFKKARELYLQTLSEKNIAEADNLHKFFKITPDLLETLVQKKISFKDGLHIAIAKKQGFIFCTHDEKARKRAKKPSLDVKRKFYEKIYKPEELLKSARKNL